MEYLALYRKYRPQTFREVIGQQHVTSTLAREVSEGRVAHAYLFAGPRGTGKTTTARVLAKALNCPDRADDGTPCNVCPSCVGITEGSSLDVLELDAASHNSVEDIRDMRVSVATVASVHTSHRVFILDEAQMLSRAAGNALLKTLEEPPPHVHFVLATTDPYKLLDTIRSRSQRFDFHPVDVEELTDHLSKISQLESYQSDPAALQTIARHAQGSVRDALSLLEQVAALGEGVVDAPGVRRAAGTAGFEAVGKLADAMVARDAAGALHLVGSLAAEGVDLRRLLAEAIGFFRGVFLVQYGGDRAFHEELPDVVAEWTRVSGELNPSELIRAIDILGEALIKVREGREERLLVELAFLQLTRPETTTDLASVTSRLERLEARLAGTPLAAGAAARPAEPPESAPLPEEPAKRAGGPETQSEIQADSQAAVMVLDEGTPLAEVSRDLSPEQGDSRAGTHRLHEVWGPLIAGVREAIGSRRWALFREVVPGRLDGNNLILNVPHSFHLEALQSDPVVGPVVATKAGDLLGIDVSVTFRSTDVGEIEAVELELDKDRLFEAPADVADPTALVKELLGAEVVEEIED